MTIPDYQAHNFVDGAAGNTPIMAAILNDIEAGIIANHNQLVTAAGVPTFPIVLADAKWALINHDCGPDIIQATPTSIGGPGDTLTANSNHALTIDGSTPAIGDRVLVADPYAHGTGFPPYSDGIYTVTNLGSVSTKWVLTRATDNDTVAKLHRFWAVRITNGTVYGGGGAAVWTLSATTGVQTFTVGSTFLGLSVWGQSCVSVGPWSTADGIASAAVGTQATASGDNGVALGNTALATGQTALAIGPYSSALAKQAVALGYQAYANAINAVALGSSCVAYAPGQLAYSSGGFLASRGDTQFTTLTLAATTTNATQTKLIGPFSGGLVLKQYGGIDDYTKTMVVRCRVVARGITTRADSAWTFQGILRGDSVSVYSWVGTVPSPVLIAQDAGASAWAPVLSVVGNELKVLVTGAAATTVNWTATVEMDEIAGASVGGGGGGSSVTFASMATSAPNTNSTSVTVNVPAGTVNGDYLLWYLSNSSTTTWTPPTGWTLLENQRNGDSQGVLYYRVASSEPASYTATTTASGPVLGAMLRYTGASGVRDHKGTINLTPSATSLTPVALVGVQPTDRVIEFYGAVQQTATGAADTMTGPGAPWTTRVTASNAVPAQWECDLVVSDATGADAVTTASDSNANVVWAVLSVALF